jgi:type IV pilus assembly protein PilO
MKLSKREKVLIFVLIITLIVYAAYKFIQTTDIFNLEALRTEYSQRMLEYNSMSQNILLKSKYEENVQTLSEEINNLPVISDLQQEQLIVFLNSYFAKNNIDASNVSFTDASVVSMSHIPEPREPKIIGSLETLMNDIDSISANTQPAVESSSENAESSAASSESTDNAQQQLEMSIKSISVNISFESTYNDMIKFIDAIQNNSVDISITNINIVAPGGNVLQGTMILNFYEVPKPAGFEENNDEWIWKDLVKSGKANPFSAGSAAVFAASVGSYDFYMSVLPDSSDLPAIILGKTGDESRTTNLYADSNAVENVSFEFKEDGGKYYYKYTAGSGKYPADGTWSEFIPVSSGNLYIKVYSSERNSKADSAGVNIGVTNTSDLKIRFEIEGDDKSNSRIYFKDPRSVVVTRK